MFRSWREEAEGQSQRPRLSERSWALIVSALASLLSLSLLLHALRARPGSLTTPFPDRRDYSYVPLNNISRTDPLAGGGGRKGGNGGFPLDESDSQD